MIDSLAIAGPFCAGPLCDVPLWAEGVLAPQLTLGNVLWGGLALLSLSLLVLMWTNWGQARPLSKCVALSLLAHVLLMGYAYGTKLLFDPAPRRVEEIVHLSIEPAHQDSDPKSQSPRPWERFAAAENAVPQPTSPARRQTSAPRLERPTTTAELPTVAPAGGHLTEPQQPIQPPERPSPDDALRVVTPATGPTAIQPPRGRRRTDEPSVAPQTDPPQRVEPSTAHALPARQSASQNLPIHLFDPTRPLQRLSDVPIELERPDALADAQDRLHAGGRQTTDAPQQNVVSSRPSQDAWVSLGNPAAASRQPLPGDATGNDPPQAQSSAPPRRLGDGRELPTVYRSRIPQQHLETARQFGGSAESEASVDAALIWIAAQQSDDGRWNASGHGAGRETKTLGHDRQGAGAQADTGITGLALLAFLARGHSHLEGQYRVNVRRGLEFLLRSQRPNGSLAGDAKLYAVMYCHGMASLALSEAYAMTGDRRLRLFVQRSVEYSVNSQHASGGGWRYQPGDAGDMSQFGWQVMALTSAEIAGIEIPDRTRAGMLRFLSRCSSGLQRGLASYRPGDRVSRTMTAEALTCRLFLDAHRDEATVREAADFISQQPPAADQANLYYWYYGTISLYQLQNDQWRAWNQALQRELLNRQRTDAPLAGSWDADTTWGSYGGRVYSTAMATLCLEVYYRYLPLYQQQGATR